jgi:hypothetical protein
MKMEPGGYKNLVDIEITGLQKMLKFLFLHPETQANTTINVPKHYSAGLHLESQTAENSANRAGSYYVFYNH